MIKIAPSILSADFMNLEDDISRVQKAGADILHLDVMDGHFVQNLTFGMPIIKQIKEIAKIPLDVHLMVSNPEIYLKQLGKWNIEYVSFHQEIAKDLHNKISVLKKYNVKVGIALNPATPIDTIFSLIKEIDYVLLMSVNPGFGGQPLLDLIYQKVTQLREYSDKYNPNLKIEIDGGVNAKNAGKLSKCGANILVAGSYIFGNDNYSKQIQSLRN